MRNTVDSVCGIWKKEMEDGDDVTFAKWNTINI